MLEKFTEITGSMTMWLWEKLLGDPTGFMAVGLFILVLFLFKPTRIFAIGALLAIVLI